MGRNKEKNEKQRTDMKKDIETKALLYFAKYGFYGTRMQDLAKAIGISSGLIYHYYPSKEELLNRIVEQILENRNNDLFAVQASRLRPRDRIYLLTDIMKEKITSSNEMAAAFTLMENLNFFEEKRPIFEKWAYPAVEILAEIIRQGQEEGFFYEENPIALAVSYWGLVSAICRDRLALGSNLQYSFDALNQMLLKESESK